MTLGLAIAVTAVAWMNQCAEIGSTAWSWQRAPAGSPRLGEDVQFERIHRRAVANECERHAAGFVH
jgi:hypothetical protein